MPFRFLRNPSELKSIKNMSLLRQQMSPPRALPHLAQHQQPSMVNIKMEPEVEADDLGPTDLSMEHPTDLSPTRPSPLCHPELQHSEDKWVSVVRFGLHTVIGCVQKLVHWLCPKVDIYLNVWMICFQHFPC